MDIMGIFDKLRGKSGAQVKEAQQNAEQAGQQGMQTARNTIGQQGGPADSGMGGSQDPNQPGSQDPAQPGYQDPAQPGYDPSQDQNQGQ